MSRSRVILPVLVVAVALALAGFDWLPVRGSFQRTLAVTGAVEMTVETGSGSIQVSRGGAGTVSIQAQIRGRDSRQVEAIERNQPIHQTGNIIEIGRLEGDLGRNISISYEITTPAATALRVSSGSGNDTVTGLDGPVRAETGSGSVALRQIGGEATAATGSGDATLADVRGAARASTGSGDIEIARAGGAARASAGSGTVVVEGAGGDVKASTGSGTIRVSDAGGAVSAETGSGSITIGGALPAAARWEARSGSGGISLHVPASAAAELDLHSSSGSIVTSLPLTISGRINRHEVHGYLHEAAGAGGGATVIARTSSGSIRVD